MVPGLLQLRAAFRRDRIDRGPKRSDGKACFSVPAPRPGGYPPACRRAFLRTKKPRARHFREWNICRCRRNACRSQKEYPGLKTFARPRFGAGGVLFCPCFDPAGRSRRSRISRPGKAAFPGAAPVRSRSGADRKRRKSASAAFGIYIGPPDPDRRLP